MTRDPERIETILRHIVDSIEAIESYVANLDFDQFLEDSAHRMRCCSIWWLLGKPVERLSVCFPTIFKNIAIFP